MTNDDSPQLPEDVLALLGDDAVWNDVDTGFEDAAIAAVLAEVSREPRVDTDVTEPDPAPQSADAVVRQLHWRSALLGAAAAVLLFVGAAGALRLAGGAERTDVELALIGTELAPDASGDASVTATPNGTRIRLTTTDLEPAPAGMYYEAWLRTGPDVGVSAGTFHLRGGDGDIELWAGVAIEDFPLLTVTLQPEGEPASSGQVVLSARLGG